MSCSFFRSIRKIAKSDCWLRRICLFVCPSVRPSAWINLHLRDFLEIWYSSIFFRKTVEKIKVSLISDRYKGHFVWRPIYFFDHISLISS